MKNLEIDNSDKIGERTIGLEFENPVITVEGNAIDFPTIQKVWRTFEKYGWTPNYDPFLPNIIDKLSKQFSNTLQVSTISDSGAGNLELAFSPQPNLQTAEAAFKLVLMEVISILKENNLKLAGLALQPGQVPNFENFRRRNAMYAAWHEMDSSDIYISSTSAPISAHQVGVGTRPEELIEIINEFIKITGLITAIGGNSPIQNWKILPFKDWRILCMSSVRIAVNKPEFEKIMGFPKQPFTSLGHLLHYYLDTPSTMLPFIRHGEWIVPEENVNLLEYFKRKDGIQGHNLKGEKVKLIPEVEDFNWALVQLWPHTKPHLSLDPAKVNFDELMENFENDTLETYLKGRLTNCYVEFRSGSAAPVGEEMALPALFFGLMNNFAGLKDITKLHSWDEWKELVGFASVHGLGAKIENDEVADLLEKLVKIAEVGLKTRNLDEEVYLQPINGRLKSHQNPADRAIEAFKKGKTELLKFISYK